MSSDTTSKGLEIDAASVMVKEKSTPWLIWLLPAIALMIGVWLIYKHYQDAGIEVVISFPLGTDIKPHETLLKFEGVKIGEVTSVQLSKDFRKILATLEIEKNRGAILQEDTVFWMVQPEVSITRVTGLDTLVSGNYITFQIADRFSEIGLEEAKKLRPTTFAYVALEEPPPRPAYLGGLHLQLVSSRPASIAKGAPVTFKKVTVGSVDRVALSEDGKSIRYSIYIEEAYKNIVNSKTRFWDVSGISIKGSLSNVELKLDSITSLLVGGISFGNDTDNESGELVHNYQEFPLFSDREEAFSKKTLIKIKFASGDGLSEGTNIKYNGLQVGEVESIELQHDLKSVVATVNIYENAVNSLRSDTLFWVVKPEVGLAATRNLDTLIGGKYITLQPGTGKSARSFVALDEPPFMQVQESSQYLKVVLLADHRGSIKQDTKIYYRNVEVGHVTGTELAADANKVHIYIAIDHKYAPLVRENTKFWNASGIDVGFKLFGGLKMKTESVESLLEGGIAFATPNNNEMGNEVAMGASFKLYEKSEEGWDAWSPKITLNDKEF